MRVKINNTSAFGLAKTIRLGARFSVLGIVALLALLVLPVNYKDGANAATGTALASNTSLTISSSNEIALLNLTPHDAAGTFASSSADGTAIFTVTTDNYAGYTLSIASSDDEGKLTNTDDNTTYYIDSIDAATTASSFDNNKWGYKPSKYVDTANNTVINNTGDDAVFLPSPTTEATLLDKTTTASTDNEYSIALGVKADYTTHAGSYSSTFNLITIANPTIVSISYNKNTEDNVTNMPANQTDEILTTNFTLRNNVPVREHYSFTGWCSTQPTTTNGTDTCSTTIYNPNGDGTNLSYGIDQTASNVATLYAMWQIDTFTQTTRYRYENIDGTFTEWEDSEEVVKNYGDTYTWDPATKITDFDGTPFTNSNAISYTVTDDNDNDITFTRKQFTITKRYKLEDENGNYPEEFTADGTETVRYGADYTYLRNVSYYYNTGVEATNITEDITLDLLKERIKYQVYVNKGSDIQSVTGAGSYRWGSTITISATKKDDTICRVYDENITWTKGSGWGGFADDYEASTVTGSAVQFIIGKGAATLRADVGHTDILQTVTFSSPNGDTITFDGVDYHDGDTTQAYCGTYNIAGTVTEQPMQDRIYLQDITPATCPTMKTRVYDNRDQEAYYIQKLADGNCWILNNLKLDPETTVPLTTANTNMSPDIAFTLPASEAYQSGFNVLDQPNIYTGAKYKGNTKNIWWTTTGGTLDRYYFLDSAKLKVSGPATLEFKEVSTDGVYYNYCAVSAGTFCVENADDWTGDKIYDLCPAGWRMPRSGVIDSQNDFAILYQSYNSDALAAIDAFNAYGGGMVTGGGAPTNQDTWGHYWSSSIYNFEGVHGYAWRASLSWNNEVFRAAESADRYTGATLRCMMDIPAEP